MDFRMASKLVMSTINAMPKLVELSIGSQTFEKIPNRHTELINRTVKRLVVNRENYFGTKQVRADLIVFVQSLLTYFPAMESCSIHNPKRYEITISKSNQFVRQLRRDSLKHSLIADCDKLPIAVERLDNTDN